MSDPTIPRGQWVTFCDTWSRRYAGQRATLNQMSPSATSTTIVEGMLFEGLSADLKDHESDITISLRDANGAQMTHIVSEVRALIDLRDSGTTPTLRIDSAVDGDLFLLIHVESGA